MIEVKSEDIAENMSKEKFEYYDNNKIKKAKISDNATFIYNGKNLMLYQTRIFKPITDMYV